MSSPPAPKGFSAFPSLTQPPKLDPTPLFEIFRGAYATELLTAAVAHFNLFARLGRGALTFEELRLALGLEKRPAVVLITALRAFGLLVAGPGEKIMSSPLAWEHLIPGGPFDVGDYIGLASKSPGVLAMVERLRTNRPAGTRPEESGAAFIYRAGLESAMEKETSARSLTLALASRARNVAPVLAERIPMTDARLLLDVGGGSGLYSIALLQKNRALRAIVWDRPEVLKVARELGLEYGVADRLECRSGDMFADDVPDGADVILLSNVLHDWDDSQCQLLIGRCVAALPPGGRLMIHDVFLNDALDGPLAVALYSAALFSLTEGRAYSAAEYRQWLHESGLVTSGVIPTLIHCGVLEGVRTKC